MILRPSGDDLLLITQPDHAALAARLMRHWQLGGLPASGRRADILIAIEEHDNGWLEPDTTPIVDRDTGRLLDFVTVPGTVRRGVWPRAVTRLAGTPYAAALVAQHALHIYRRYKGEAEWDAFFAQMEAERGHFLAAAGVRDLGALKRDYVFLRIGDLLSLTWCNAWREPQTDDAGSGTTVHLEGDELVLSPDPFAGRRIPFEVAARKLPGAPWISADAAARAWAAAEVVTVKGTARGPLAA
jgi:hypothetical protein